MNCEMRGIAIGSGRAPVVVGMTGSPSTTSKTARLCRHILSLLEERGCRTHLIELSTIDPAALLRGNMSDPGLRSYIGKVEECDGLLITTPIFKASFSGLLKASLDILPQFGLAGKVVMPIGVGGSVAHALALDYGLRPVLQSMAARHVVQSYLVQEGQLSSDDGGTSFDEATDKAITCLIENFLYSIDTDAACRGLGAIR